MLQRSPPDLELQDVSKSYGDVTAADHVSLTVHPGEFFSLLGPSGCGKTTTLRLVAGLESTDGGRILLRGEDITSAAPNQRRVNTVFQHYALFPHMSVEDNVAYGLKQKRVPRNHLSTRLSQALETVRLDELRNRHPRELSGGQQQRVALARALINEPALLLLDEPLAALDLKLRKAMQAELKKLQERVGISFLYVTHDQEEALTLSDRIAVMNHGRLLQVGTADEIYDRPRTRFVADFIGQTNFFPGRLVELGKSAVVETTSGKRLECRVGELARKDMKVVVSVRPESVLPADGHTSTNVLRGTLTRVVYLGDSSEYHIEVRGEGAIVMRRQLGQESMADRWRVGETIDVSWSSARALALLDDEVADEHDRSLAGAREIPDVLGRRVS